MKHFEATRLTPALPADVERRLNEPPPTAISEFLVEHYREHGFVKLEQVISEATLRYFREVIGYAVGHYFVAVGRRRLHVPLRLRLPPRRCQPHLCHARGDDRRIPIRGRDLTGRTGTHASSTRTALEPPAWVAAWAQEHIDPGQCERFRDVAEREPLSLHEGSFARYRVRPSEFEAWQEAWTGSWTRDNSTGINLGT